VNLDKLKAYLQNPDIALERMKRLVPSEGERVEAARANIEGFEQRPATNEEVLQQVANEDRAMEMAAGMAGTVGAPKSAAQMLKEAAPSKWGKVVVKDTAPKTFGKVRHLVGK
jgi:hypothetical protein